jgi:hypothetical protein
MDFTTLCFGGAGFGALLVLLGIILVRLDTKRPN